MPGRDRAGSAGGGSGLTSESATANALVVNRTAKKPAARRPKPVWRARNPGYATAHRISQRHQDKTADPARTPPPLNQLPWDLAKDQFGGQGADFIGVLGTLLFRTAKDQISSYLVDGKSLSGTLPPQPEKTRSTPAHTGARADATGVSSTGPPPGKSSGPASGAPTAADRFAG